MSMHLKRESHAMASKRDRKCSGSSSRGLHDCREACFRRALPFEGRLSSRSGKRKLVRKANRANVTRSVLESAAIASDLSESSVSKTKDSNGRRRIRMVQLSVKIDPAIVPILDDEARAARIDRADIIRQLVEAYAFRKAKQSAGKYPLVDEMFRVREETRESAEP